MRTYVTFALRVNEVDKLYFTVNYEDLYTVLKCCLGSAPKDRIREKEEESADIRPSPNSVTKVKNLFFPSGVVEIWESQQIIALDDCTNNA